MTYDGLQPVLSDPKIGEAMAMDIKENEDKDIETDNLDEHARSAILFMVLMYSLPKFEGLRGLTILNYFPGSTCDLQTPHYLHIRHPYDFIARPAHVDWLAWDGHDDVPDRLQITDLQKLMSALGRCNVKLTHFSTMSGLSQAYEEGAHIHSKTVKWDRSSFAPSFSVLSRSQLHDAANVLATLTHLHIEMTNCPPYIRELCTGNGALPCVLKGMLQLQSLSLILTRHHSDLRNWSKCCEVVRLEKLLPSRKLTNLLKIRLQGFRLEPEELLVLLENHKTTLQELILVEIDLGAAQRSSTIRGGPWRQVADVCQRMANLSGLFVHGLGGFGTTPNNRARRWVVSAMQGRPNYMTLH